MLPVIQIGPLALQTPGLIIILGMWLGITLGERHSSDSRVPPHVLENLILIMVASGLVGARLAYVIRYPVIFLSSPFSLVSPNPGLLDLWAGLATGLIVAIIYIQRKSLSFWNLLDGLTPVLGIISIALSLSNFASGSGYGAPTELPWGIYLWGAHRHPAQIYEALAAIIILVITWPGPGWRRYSQAGMRFLSFCSFSAITRIFLEAYRGDSTIIIDGLRAGQLVAWLILVLSLYVLNKRIRLPAESGVYHHNG